MSLHDELEALATDKARQVFVTEMRRGYSVTSYGNPLVPVSELAAILARDPEPTVSDDEREGLAATIRAVFESIPESVIVRALDIEGAQIGDCGHEPGDAESCDNGCRELLARYATAIKAHLLSEGGV